MVQQAKEALNKAETAYTAAVQAACQTGQWALVHAARHAVDQCRSTLEHRQQQQEQNEVQQ